RRLHQPGELQAEVVGRGRLVAAQPGHRPHQFGARRLGIVVQRARQPRIVGGDLRIADADDVIGPGLDHVLQRDRCGRLRDGGVAGPGGRGPGGIGGRRRRVAPAAGEQRQRGEQGEQSVGHGGWAEHAADPASSKKITRSSLGTGRSTPRETPAAAGCARKPRKEKARPEPGFPWRERQANYIACTSSACRPFWPCTTLKETFWPSCRDLKPVPWIERKWTKTSGPLSGVMKPKPLASLNHLTVPV